MHFFIKVRCLNFDEKNTCKRENANMNRKSKLHSSIQFRQLLLEKVKNEEKIHKNQKRSNYFCLIKNRKTKQDTKNIKKNTDYTKRLFFLILRSRIFF